VKNAKRFQDVFQKSPNKGFRIEALCLWAQRQKEEKGNGKK